MKKSILVLGLALAAATALAGGGGKIEWRQTLLQMVRENGGRIISDEQTGSVIDMELELY